MTYRDLIIYILENKLENEEVFKDGKIAGFMTLEEAAVKFGVGVETVKVWIELGMMGSMQIGTVTYVPSFTDVINVIRR